MYEPCLPMRVQRAPTGPNWITEIKHDGYRLIARRVGKNVRLYTKNGYDWAERYPLIVEAISKMRVSSIVLDGEAMCFKSNGLDDFDALWNRTNDHKAILCAFDLLELNGEDFRQKPLAERKKRLAKLLSKDRDGLRYVDHLDGDGNEIFEHACKLGLEGIVLKRIDMRYQHGPAKCWQKLKNKKHPANMRVLEMHERERTREKWR
jgi:ATP-dependent DNA ligase